MKKLIMIVLLSLTASGSAQFYVDKAASQKKEAIDFCSQGRFLIFAGNCSLPKKSKYKDSVTLNTCSDIPAFLSRSLGALYPRAEIEIYRDLTPDSVFINLTQPAVLGFFFIGEGDARGGFVTGPQKEKFYPDIDACVSKYDLYGGFTSHSKYSPTIPAPPAARGRVLSRVETLYGDSEALPDSWTRLCKPKLSLVYPTRTLAGRMKEDAAKFFETLQDEKKKQILKTLENICPVCPRYVAAGHPIARLCPPNSDACKTQKMSSATAKFILENYCQAVSP
ncbi:MAG: hypothetical protein A2021_02485 [Elusimicrobia bacterium GWF2_52_66]|nr:MAG: hypothetical protein A2X33_04300 [Elusimicrobia bacterium GWA2_51_34]OGR84619.1 MAG: hypothetical protein A2021_02485 [Elusimicrobia bacterium GWF2_52_66]HAF95936.1 hypothetical protein [Elusimicrobiota bacterium]HCE97548.1 hypothetical protein [Elusimicrobiota bacterium]